MKFKMVNLVSAFKGDLLGTLRTWIRRWRTRHSIYKYKAIPVSALKLGHRVGDSQRTLDRVSHIRNALPYIPPTYLYPEQLNFLLPSDEYIIVDTDMTVINGNGRVGALQEAGYTGMIVVKHIQG